MNKQKSSPRKHHYVPESYLKRFTSSDGFLNVWDRHRSEFRIQKPKEVMTIRDYNCQSWAPEGTDPNILEIGLGNDLEKIAKIAIDYLIDKPEALDDEHAAKLLIYLEFQRIRVPRQAEAAKELMRETILRLAPSAITKSIQDGEFLLTMKESARFDYIRIIFGHLHPWFARMEWEVVTAEEGSVFVTTDSPVSLYNPACIPPAEAGIGMVGTKILFPLNSKHLLIMRHPECRFENLLTVLDIPECSNSLVPIKYGTVWDRHLVTNTNIKLSLLAYHFVVGENKEMLELCSSTLNKYCH